jgi:hypothetical protein
LRGAVIASSTIGESEKSTLVDLKLCQFSDSLAILVLVANLERRTILFGDGAWFRVLCEYSSVKMRCKDSCSGLLGTR